MAGMRSFVSSALRALALLVAALWALPAAAANCNLATSQGSTGPNDWQTYCWLDLASYNDTTARGVSGQAFSYTLPDGTLMTFRLKVTGPALVSAASSSWTGAAVGNTAFLGISGRPILYQNAGGTSVVTYQLTPQLRLGAGVNFRSKQAPADVTAPAWQAPGYATVDLLAEYAFSERWLLKASITNLTDKYYAGSLYRGHYVPGAGRLALLTLTARF